MTVKIAGSLGATLLTACLLACGSTSTSSGPSASAGPTAGAGSGAASPGSPGPASPAVQACRAGSLTITLDASQAGGAAGSSYYPIDFTNTASTACGMYGYPGVSFVTAGGGAGRQIGAAAQRNPGFGNVEVRLAAGGTAHAWLQVATAGNYPASTCQPVTAHWLRVFPPGDTSAGYVQHTFDSCASTSVNVLTVMPARAGKGIQGVTP